MKITAARLSNLARLVHRSTVAIDAAAAAVDHEINNYDPADYDPVDGMFVRMAVELQEARHILLGVIRKMDTVAAKRGFGAGPAE